ncbi:MAG: ABC transporter permease [Actinomycetota bacterium]|nr:ABC transporter permease [Actinomycetota bacterium]
MMSLRVLEANARGYRRTWKGSAMSAFLNPVLFLLSMGMGLGTLVDSNPAGDALPEGITYVSFIASGLLAATAMQTGAGEGSWPVFAGIKWIKSYHAALATPVRVGDLVAGNLLWVGVRVALSAVAFAIVSAVLGAISPVEVALAVPGAVLTGMAFAAPVTGFTALAKDETKLSSLFRFGIIPMFLFSGTFFPVELLPGWLQPVAFITPLWHGVELCRTSALGIDSALPSSLHIAYLVVWTAAGWVVARWALARRLQP